MDIRGHTTPKAVMTFAEADNQAINGQQLDFLANVVEAIDQNPFLTEGKWKMLYACVRTVALSRRVNYCIYRNKFGVNFDVTLHTAYMDGEDVDQKIVEESSSDKIKRLLAEIDQVDIKIEHLKETRCNLVERLNAAKVEFVDIYERINKVITKEC